MRSVWRAIDLCRRKGPRTLGHRGGERGYRTPARHVPHSKIASTRGNCKDNRCILSIKKAHRPLQNGEHVHVVVETRRAAGRSLRDDPDRANLKESLPPRVAVPGHSLRSRVLRRSRGQRRSSWFAEATGRMAWGPPFESETGWMSRGKTRSCTTTSLTRFAMKLKRTREGNRGMSAHDAPP